ncbi:MAG TPA: type II secretion system protein GspF [Gammaproteobacteria bacterium]|nr:type II secretion system protein GspF [Gammaproteobacteria bacterium]|tara:strand:+ start:312 stop:1523 length:1212 start_codon:yes stop_codon:yes gene_type:complete
MAAFEYNALDKRGKQKKGVIEADSARHARQLLRDDGLAPIEVQLSQSRSSGSGLQLSLTRRLSAFDRMLFTRQLSTLVGSSLPLEEALAAAAEQSDKQSVRGLIMAVRSKVLEGYTLANSLREHPASFNSLYCSSVSAGEQSGFLAQVLANLADYLERQFTASRNVEMALFYPIALLVLAFGIVGALMVYVVPDMIQVIEDNGQSLPWYTELLVSITEVLQNYWWLLLLAIGLIALTARQLLRVPHIKLRWDRNLFRLPLVAKIARSANAARYANTLAILTKSGVPLVQAMGIASDVVDNTWLKQGLQNATQTVSEGVSLKMGLERVGHLPPMMLHMVGAGEQSGELDNMLGRVAEYQQTEVERVVGTLVKLFEPMMLLIMGGLVMFIVMAILVPMLSMNQIV